MVDRLAQLTKGRRNSSISIPPLVASIDFTNLLLQTYMLVACQGRLPLVVESAARDASELEQAGQREVLP